MEVSHKCSIVHVKIDALANILMSITLLSCQSYDLGNNIKSHDSHMTLNLTHLNCTAHYVLAPVDSGIVHPHKMFRGS